MIPQTLSGHEEGFNSGILAATLLFLGLYDLFLVVTYTLSRTYGGDYPYFYLFLLASMVFTFQDRRVLPFYVVGLWLATAAFVLYLYVASTESGLSSFTGFAQITIALVGAGTLTVFSPRVGPVLARRRAQGKFA